jgi:hypothetical protein
MPINIDGKFYPHFTEDTERFSDNDRESIRRTVEHLITEQTSAARPGMLLGKIQSGKTKTFLAIIALAFDNGFDIALILTKGTKALARQTLERVRRDYGEFCKQDQLQIFDIMTVPRKLTGYEVNQKIIFVSKKQTDNLERLATLFRDTYPQLAQKRILIIDDEADYASIGFQNTREQGVMINRTAQQIDGLRQILLSSAFLQVTATPYSLYLQPENLQIQGVEFRPIRPAFTELVPVNSQYVGSDYYFDRSLEENTGAYVYQPVSTKELKILRRQDRRRFRVEECLTSDAISILRSAICNFIVGGCIRRLQEQHEGKNPRKFSFLIHTEAKRVAHTWQEKIVITLNEKLKEAVHAEPMLLTHLLTASYDDLAVAIRSKNHYLPPCNDVLGEAFTALEQDWLMITKVNSERQIEELLDDGGQLRLRTPLNIFIGGQILDRGITISNLIGFFYGRNPQLYQQDTVLQHSRMFGFRPIEDLTVTRFYTEPQIYDAMRRMHESDVALRNTFERNPDQPVVFIQRDKHGRIIPCNPNKILVSNTTTLQPFKRILPIGFQTANVGLLQGLIREIDQTIERLRSHGNMDRPFEISLEEGIGILSIIQRTLIMETEEGYKFDWVSTKAALSHLSNSATNTENRGRILCLVLSQVSAVASFI